MSGSRRAAPLTHLQRRPAPPGGGAVQTGPGEALDSALWSSFSEMDTEDSFSDSELLSDFERSLSDSEDDLSELEDDFSQRRSYLDSEDSFSESELGLDSEDSFSDSEDFVSEAELQPEGGYTSSDLESHLDVGDGKATPDPGSSLAPSRLQTPPLRRACPAPAVRTEKRNQDRASPRSANKDRRVQGHQAPKPPAPPRRAPPLKGHAPLTLSRGEPARGAVVSPKSDGSSTRGDVPPQTLSLCLQKLESADWKEKVNGLKSIQTLMKQQPQQVKGRLREVCVVVTEEVKNLRFAVVCCAMDTLRELHRQFGTSMDHMAAVTGKALLLKVNKSATKSICQQANAALEALVQGCSPGTVLTTLLGTGLSHRDAAVRGSTAQHLFQLTHIVARDWIFGDGLRFAHRFFNAVSKMSQDAAPEVRHFGKKILQEHSTHKHFLSLWTKSVPENERRTVVLPHVPRQNTVT